MGKIATDWFSRLVTTTVTVWFFGNVGCPLSDDPTPKATSQSVAIIPSASVHTSGGNKTFPISEPDTLVLLGSGLVGLATFGRKRFKK